MTMKVSKGLGVAVMAMSSLGYVPCQGRNTQEAARVF